MFALFLLYCHLFWKFLLFIDAAIKISKEIKTTIMEDPFPPVLSKAPIKITIILKIEIYLKLFVVFINSIKVVRNVMSKCEPLFKFSFLP